MINIKGAKRHNITKLVLDNDIDAGLMRVINQGLDNRKVRDTGVNETSSRSILVFNIYVTWKHKSMGNGNCKFAFVDLCGYERVANIPIDSKRYLETLFINESLHCLQHVVGAISAGKRDKTDFKIHNLTHILSDTLGAYESVSQILVCMGPSAIDQQDTVATMDFAVSTGKVRRFIGPYSGVAGYPQEHIITFNGEGKAQLIKGLHAICQKPFEVITRRLSTLNLAAIS